MRQAPQFNHRKYQPPPPFSKKDRRWPDQSITQAPDFCSVDLRDGNQALIEPMSSAQKLEMFELLVQVGFKEIEVGFPSASSIDFQFVRQLIDENRIPDDVLIQVLVPARAHLITRTFEALQGARRAIVHLYNSTSKVQREEVFKMNKEEVKQLAVSGARMIREAARKQSHTQFYFEYSPESFTGTELEYALEVCDAVCHEWQPSRENQVVINLPATVENTSPHVYADQIEWMSDHLKHRKNIRVSLHTHNDRGCGVAAAELGVLAGADRVEGTLLGNGERTGNMDIVTMAMNLYSHGVDPKLDLSQMDQIRSTVERCTNLPIHPRHPYAGDLVFAAFSGSHQDAIGKCLSRDQSRRQTDPACDWHVAYLPIDPRDLGRSYQEVVRVNSQSGKGGVAFLLEREHHIKLPKWLQVDFSHHVQGRAETVQSELNSDQLLALFEETYVNIAHSLSIQHYDISRKDDHDCIRVQFEKEGPLFSAIGQGAIDAFIRTLCAKTKRNLVLVNYEEHTLGADEKAEAIAFVELSCSGSVSEKTSTRICGVARSRDVLEASFQAILNALERNRAPGA